MTRFAASLFLYFLLLPACNGGKGATSDEDTDDVDTDDVDTDDVDRTSDFTPATGAAEGPADHGPWDRRLRVATSDDGTTWTRTGVTVSDQGDVPSVLVEDGALWLFYVIWSDADDRLHNTTVAAVTTDLENWAFKELEYSGMPEGWTPTPVDPTVVSVGDGSYRMYFTLGPTQQGAGAFPATHSATSTDLVRWTVEDGRRFENADGPVLDPNLVWVGDHYEFFAGGIIEENYHGTSTDGLTFTALSPFVTDPFVVMANGAEIEGGITYFGFKQMPAEPKDIRSLAWDGATWTLEDGALLEVDEGTGEEADFVADPAVAPHPSGDGYVMIYVTQIP